MREEDLLNRLREVVRGEPERTPDPIGSLAVRLGWITSAQLQECIDDPRPVGARLVSRGLIDAQRLALLLQLERERPASGNLEMPDEAWIAARDPANWFGPYLLTGLLGEGAMARVYGAWDRRLCRSVAVKILKEESAGRVERMIREARAAARLSHPNIVPVFEAGEIDGRHYIAMGRIQGTTLEECRHEPRRVAEMMRDLARALSYAHANGILHRDLKPSNLLADEQGAVYIADFGLAKETKPDTSTAQSAPVLGTPAFAPPEQLTGDRSRVDARSDVYGLGATMYTLLTGQLPFGGETLYEVIENVIHREPVAPRVLQPAIPRDLETICLKTMAKEKPRRYSSAVAMAEDLERYLAGEPIEARPSTLTYRMLKRVKRNPWAWGVTAVAVVGAIAAGLMLQGSRARRYELGWKILRPIATGIDDLETLKWTQEDPGVLQRSAGPWKQQLDALIEDRPDFGPAYSWRGKIKEILEEPGVEEDLDRGCEVDPESAEVWYVRGMYRAQSYQLSRLFPDETIDSGGIEFAALPDESAQERGWREGALGDLRRLEQIADEDAFFGPEKRRQARASLKLHEGRYEEALRQLEGINTQRARWARGLALYHLNRFEEAREELGRMLKNWPRHAEGWVVRGDSGHAAGFEKARVGSDPSEDFKRAIGDFGRAIEENPQLVDVYNNRGITRIALGEWTSGRGGDPTADYEAAVTDFGRAIEKNPEHVYAYNNRGNAWAMLGERKVGRGVDPSAEYEAAIADFGRVIEKDPEYAYAYNNRGAARWALGKWKVSRGADPTADYEAAIADYDCALVRNANHVGAHFNKARALEQLGRTAEALVAAERALAIDPDDRNLRAIVRRLRTAMRRESDF